MSEVLQSINQASAAAIAAVINSFWQAVALAAVAWLLMRFTPRMNAATRHLLWWALLAVVALLPIMPTVMDAVRAPAAPSVLAASAPIDPVTPEASPLPSAAPVAPARQPQAPLELSAGYWPTWILALWAAVLSVQLGRVAWSYSYLRRVKREARPAPAELRQNFDAWMLSCGVRRPARLLVSSRIASPMAVGFREPAVVLPEQLLTEFQEAELDHVLLHELAHISRRDDWSNLAARVAGGVFALHPVAAWVLRSLEREREIACDDWVVSMTGEARPYAASLARLFELCFARRRMMLATGMADSASHLGRRIEMLLRKAEFAPRASMVRIALSTAALLALVIAGSQTPGWFAFAQDRTPPAAPEPPQAAPVPPAVQTPRAPVAPESAEAEPAPPAPPAPLAEFQIQLGNLQRELAFLSKDLRPQHPRIQRLREQIAALASPPPPSPAPFQAPQPPPPPAAPDRGSFLAALAAAGYGDLSVDQIILMKNAGISAEFLRSIGESGWGKLPPEELIGLSQRGVHATYLRKMKDAGFKNLTLNEVIEMASVGVRAETIQEIHALGFGPYSPRQAIQFAQVGVRAELFRALKEDGYGKAEPNEIIEVAQVGLNARDLREAKQYGSTLTLKQVIRLKNAGVL